MLAIRDVRSGHGVFSVMTLRAPFLRSTVNIINSLSYSSIDFNTFLEKLGNNGLCNLLFGLSWVMPTLGGIESRSKAKVTFINPAIPLTGSL